MEATEKWSSSNLSTLFRVVHSMTVILAASVAFLAQTEGFWPTGKLEVPVLYQENGKPYEMPTKSSVTVFVVLGVDCPIANRYAPEIRRIYEDYSQKGVRFFRVYIESMDNSKLVTLHTKEYQYKFPALIDPEKQFVKKMGVRVTPEAVLLNSKGELVYRGRIDSRNIDHGKVRPDYRKDLRIAIQETLSGKPVTERSTAAIGCFIGN